LRSAAEADLSECNAALGLSVYCDCQYKRQRHEGRFGRTERIGGTSTEEVALLAWICALMRAAAAAAAEAAELALLVEEGSSMLRDTGLRSRVTSASRLEGDLDRRSDRERRGSLLGSWSKRDLLRGCSDILTAAWLGQRFDVEL